MLCQIVFSNDSVNKTVTSPMKEISSIKWNVLQGQKKNFNGTVLKNIGNLC